MIDEALIGLAADRLHDDRIRKLIRFGLAERAAKLDRLGDDPALLRALSDSPLDTGHEAANRQHYRVPAAFFETVLGPHLKYSCCLWPEKPSGGGPEGLQGAEEAMLDLVMRRSGAADGEEILDLGCGWGALTLALAARFPAARITGLSGSPEQRDFILARAAERGRDNISVETAEVGSWSPGRRFDRILSIEMFEHVRNWPALLARVAGWLVPQGRLFVHVFCHAGASYLFEGDVTSRHFFTGGMMPSLDLLPRLRGDFRLLEQQVIEGGHYSRTAEAWLANLDARRPEALAALSQGADPRPPELQYAAWRLFFLITSESFAYQQGRRWHIAHYLLEGP